MKWRDRTNCECGEEGRSTKEKPHGPARRRQMGERRGPAPARRQGGLFQARRGVPRPQPAARPVSGRVEPLPSLFRGRLPVGAPRGAVSRAQRAHAARRTVEYGARGERRGLGVRLRRGTSCRGPVPACAAARALHHRGACLHDPGHRADAVGCADAQGREQRVVRDHPHVQLGLRRHRGADAGHHHPAGAAPRDRRTNMSVLKGINNAVNGAAIRSPKLPTTSRWRCCSPRSTALGAAGWRAGAICAGKTQTEADWRMFPSLGALRRRHYVAYKCKLRRPEDYHNLSNYLREPTRRPASPRPATSPA